MKVVLISAHGDDLGYDGLLGPVWAELFHQLFEVVSGGLADGKHMVNQPSHAKCVKLLIEKLDSKLTWKKKKKITIRHLLKNGLACQRRDLPARSGIYSIIASLTRHLVSSASSTMAGSRDWESCWIPMTSLTQSKLEMMFNRTSGHSSLSWDRKSGNKCSMVLEKKNRKGC